MNEHETSNKDKEALRLAMKKRLTKEESGRLMSALKKRLLGKI